jgi:hypothetical protein
MAGKLFVATTPPGYQAEVSRTLVAFMQQLLGGLDYNYRRAYVIGCRLMHLLT